MKRFDLWKLSVLNVFSSPLRSMLTMLGFAIGVAAILAVLTLGDAGRSQVQSEMSRLGIDRIWVTETDTGMLPWKTGDWLAETMNIQAQELVFYPVEVKSKAGTIVANVIGCEANYLTDVDLKTGRLFWPVEYKMDTDSAVIGAKLAKKISVEVGERIAVDGQTLLITGIIDGKAGISTISLEDAIIRPLYSACQRVGGMINELQLTASENISLRNAQKRAVRLLESQGHSVNTMTMEVQMEAASSVIFTFVNVLKWVALVCVLVGGIGVMNILLVSIRERRREIGVMKSLGTTPAQICLLFLLEALVYAVVGGVAGIVIGIVLIDVAGQSIELTAHAAPGDCMTVLACAMITGLVFGVLPALKASFLHCVEALRQE